jgi:hypothetical protein
MVKKISILLLVAAILITGFISLKKLNYIDRSAMVFRVESSAFPNQARGERQATGDRPARQGFEERGVRPGFEGRGRNFSERGSVRRDSLRSDRQIPDRFGNDSISRIRGSFDGGFRREDDGNERGSRSGKSINLSNVLYFLSVFAAFTVIAIYVDKAISRMVR